MVVLIAQDGPSDEAARFTLLVIGQSLRMRPNLTVC